MLIIIDMINDFMPGGKLAVPDADKLIPGIRKRLEEAMDKNEIVVMLTDNHKATDKEFELFGEHAVEFTKGSAIVADLCIDSLFSTYWRLGKYFHVPKTTYNGFYETELAKILKEKYPPTRPKPVELCGVCTSICIMETASWVFFMGYKVVVNQNLVADLTSEAHEYGLNRIKALYNAEII